MKAMLAMLTAVLVSMPAAAHDYCPKAECEKVKQQIRTVEARMRQGYTRAQGERLSRRLRELRAQRSQRCR